MPTYAPAIRSVPSVKVDGTSVTLINAAELGAIHTTNLKSVLSMTGSNVPVIIINATDFGKHRIPQPFANALIELFLGSDVQFPDAFKGKPYEVNWTFATGSLVGMSLFSGTVPPGLTWAQTGPAVWTITGTPTTIGSYTFVLKCIVAETFGYITLHINVVATPGGGGSAYIGGI